MTNSHRPITAIAHAETHWQTLWTKLHLASPTGLLERLLLAWRKPQRHYHTLQHLGECLALFDELRAEARHPCEIELALWFHDAVYDVHAHDNEARSAQWAVQALDAAGLDAHACRRIHDLIMATRHTASPAPGDAALIVDIDLAILGANEVRFAEYQSQIRAEYAWVAPDIYATRRTAILQGFLDRRQIYSTPSLHARLEQRARTNLARAIAAQP